MGKALEKLIKAFPVSKLSLHIGAQLDFGKSAFALKSEKP